MEWSGALLGSVLCNKPSISRGLFSKSAFHNNYFPISLKIYIFPAFPLPYCHLKVKFHCRSFAPFDSSFRTLLKDFTNHFPTRVMANQLTQKLIHLTLYKLQTSNSSLHDIFLHFRNKLQFVLVPSPVLQPCNLENFLNLCAISIFFSSSPQKPRLKRKVSFSGRFIVIDL